MQNNLNFRFVRRRERNGWFSWPTLIYELSSENGSPLFAFAIRSNAASFTSADRRDSFQLKKSFFGYKWQYDEGTPYCTIRFGLFRKPSISFADGGEYRMQLKRQWNFLRKVNPGAPRPKWTQIGAASRRCRRADHSNAIRNHSFQRFFRRRNCIQVCVP